MSDGAPPHHAADRSDEGSPGGAPGSGAGTAAEPASRSLAGRRILVTGASSGIGASTARHLARQGAQVAVLARRATPLQRLADELDGVAAPADVTDPDATRAAIDGAAGALGGLDGIVNAAGVLRAGPFLEFDPDDLQTLFDVNVRGQVHATQSALPHLLRAEGARDVVNVSSMSGRRLGSATSALYAASKAAVHMLSEGVRREFKDERVRVTVVAPGFVRTELFDASGQELSELEQRAMATGLEVDRVAAGIAHVLSAPEDLVHVEVAMVSVEQ